MPWTHIPPAPGPVSTRSLASQRQPPERRRWRVRVVLPAPFGPIARIARPLDSTAAACSSSAVRRILVAISSWITRTRVKRQRRLRGSPISSATPGSRSSRQSRSRSATRGPRSASQAGSERTRRSKAKQGRGLAPAGARAASSAKRSAELVSLIRGSSAPAPVVISGPRNSRTQVAAAGSFEESLMPASATRTPNLSREVTLCRPAGDNRRMGDGEQSRSSCCAACRSSPTSSRTSSRASPWSRCRAPSRPRPGSSTRATTPTPATSSAAAASASPASTPTAARSRSPRWARKTSSASSRCSTARSARPASNRSSTASCWRCRRARCERCSPATPRSR